MKRRDLLKTGATAAAASIAGVVGAPAIAHSKPRFRWRMTDAYPVGTPYLVAGPGGSQDFAQRVYEMSDGELEITHYGAGELIPALQGFEAVRNGTVAMNAANSYFWSGYVPAAQVFSSVPFGMNARGMASWLYSGGGLELWQELYEPFNLVPLPLNDSGVQMTGWFRDPLESIEDLNGIKIRAPGLGGDILAEVGADVQVLPGGEIFPALERGVIDAAEFVGPYLDRRLGLQKAASYYYTTGWHEPHTTGELIINKDQWDELPDDLKAVVRNAAQACHLITLAENDAMNGEALKDLVENHGVDARPLPDDIADGLRDASLTMLDRLTSEDAQFKRVYDAYISFRDQWWEWATISEGQYHDRIRVHA